MSKKPDDKFEIYFSEKIWEMIPSVYRHEDGIAENQGVLRAIVEVVAREAAILRRSHDRLWEDQSIEYSDDWVAPYLADLVGTRLISALNKRARRVDVAKTIYYRRRKGTLRVLEELVSDITGWEGKVVENFRRLGRTRHGLDPQPAPLAGRFTGTMPGGLADLRQQRGSELVGTPFDEYHHTVDVRRHHGVHGRYNISKLAFHLYRLSVYKVEGVTPYPRLSFGYTFDPSGREIPLFMPRNRPSDYDWDEWRSALEWELPAPIRCRVLGHAEYVINESLIQSLFSNGLSQNATNELRTLRGRKFRTEGSLREILETLMNSSELLEEGDDNNEGIYFQLLGGAIIDDCGKKALLPNAIQVVDTGVGVSRQRVVVGDLSKWEENTPVLRRWMIDVERGRFLFLDDQSDEDEENVSEVTVTYHYGFSGEIGAGSYDRREIENMEPNRIHQGGGNLALGDSNSNGITQINDSKTYDLDANIQDVQNLTLQAANLQRPYLRLNSNMLFNTGVNTDSELTLDGLWIGGMRNNTREIVLHGDFERVIIRHTTLDPGGTDVDKIPILSVPLVIEAKVELLVIDASITGPILTRNGGVVEKLVVCDSIIHGVDPPGGLVLSLNVGEVELHRVTAFGAMAVHRLHASEALITGNVEVTDTQNGCFRFSAAPEGSRLPKPYESHVIKGFQHYFTSRSFGHPGYAQLSETAPITIRRGAENGSEMGAFSSLINPIKLDSLKAKVDEYMPFGLIPIFVNET